MYSKAKEKRLRQLSILKFMGASWHSIEQKICNDPSLKAQEGTVSLKTVRNDWSNRDEWLDEVWEFEDNDKLVKGVLAEKQRLKHKAWEMLRQLQNEADEARKSVEDKSPQYGKMLGMLRFIDNLGSNEVELLQSLGQVEKEPDRHEVTLENAKQKLTDRLAETTET